MTSRKYLVQCKHPDGEISCGMFTAQQIIDMFGMRDCSGCEYVVYDVSAYGRAEKLEHRQDSFQEPRYHRFVNPIFGMPTVFSGYHEEH